MARSLAVFLTVPPALGYVLISTKAVFVFSACTGEFHASDVDLISANFKSEPKVLLFGAVCIVCGVP